MTWCDVLVYARKWIVSTFLYKQQSAYVMRVSDWRSDVCSSDLAAHHRQQAGEHGQVELAPGQREVAGHDQHVMQGGQDRGDRELPLEAEGDVDQEADDHEQQRPDRVARQVLADLRADELRAGRPEETTAELQSLKRNSYAA